MIGKQGNSLIKGHQGVQDKQTLSDANETVVRGIYDATTLSDVDADLVAANIAFGIILFGITGILIIGGLMSKSPSINTPTQDMSGSAGMAKSPAINTPTKAWT